MPQTLSLSELKAQNAAAEEAEAETVEEVEEEIETEEEVEVETEESEEAETESEVEEESEPVQIEDWMKSDDETEPESDGFKPNSLAATLRRKSKEKLAKKDEEIEALRAKVEALEKGPAAKATDVAAPPKLEDYDYDEAKFQAAQLEWANSLLDSKLNERQTQTEQTRQAEAQKRAMETALDSHYNRAAKLIESGMMSEDQYSSAESVLTGEIDKIIPGKGDVFVSSIIATLSELGEGSEKVTYMLGVNKSKRDKLIQMLSVNPGSPAVAAYLGQLSAQASMPAKRKSAAPAPATQIKSGGKGKAESLYETYKKMKAGPDRVTFKRKAKRDGVDVSKW